MKRQLILEDGTAFVGEAFGSLENVMGEVVFHTGMTGYQEILTDPSFAGQIVTLTYPLIGNYGINNEDLESFQPAVKGLIVKEAAEFPSNFRSQMTIDEYCKMKNIPGLQGIDTRKLTRIIRSHGTLKGMLCSIDVSNEDIVNKLKQQEVSKDLVANVSTVHEYPSPGRGHRVVLVDFGMKHSILRELNQRDCNVIVVPHNATSDQILSLKPDGVLLSNGPGNPKDVTYAVQMIKEIISEVPVYGIGLGHQLFALACGANTEKMKFGHRGSSVPVKDLVTEQVVLTSQNHGYAVNKESIANTDVEITHISINDESVEGLRHKKYPTFTVQFYPEASPGSEDANYLFDQFIDMIEKWEVAKA